MSTMLFQLELDQSLVNCGMSYIYQLASGSFIIIDGGYFTPGEEDRLFSLLSQLSSGRPHIKGWFFSHAHQDHIGCFINFIEKYHDKADIDELFYNFQPTRHRFAPGDWQKKSNDLATIKHFYKVIKKYSSFFSIHTLKTDECFAIEELKFEVLYTQENLYPEKASFNDYSAVFSVEYGNQKTIFLGDIQSKGSAFLLEHKSGKLKADIVQFSHHGFNGATKELYAAIDPSVILFPAPDFEYEKNCRNDVNSYALNDLNVRETIISGYGDAALTLPYTVGTAKKSEKKFFAVTI